jgi:O-antigen/teichoic acid export membrane protein
VKLVLGLAFVYFLRNNLAFAVAGATFAITLSEAVALFQLYWTYKKDKKKYQLSAILTNQKFSFQAIKIIKTAVPITLIGIMIPFSHVIDSFLTVNLLSTYKTDATALYGLLSGVVTTVINLPVSVCYGIATVAIPTVSASKTERDKNKNALKTVLLTLAVSLPCALFFVYFSSFTINLLFARLPIEQKQIAIKLLRLTAPCVVLLSLLQTCNAVLIGKGKPYLPLISLSVGIAVKTMLNLILLKMPNFNIYGGAIALIACYFIVCLVNFIIIFNVKVNRADKKAYRRQCVG